QLRFYLADSCRLIRSPWPIVAIWQGHQPGHSLQVDLQAGGETALVSRHGGRVMVRTQTAGMAALLLAIQQEQALGDAADQALQAETSFDLQAGLALLFSDGLLSHYQL
ncbi:MAG: DUF2063 domain-containing protein, partial [Aquitalea sp.]|nr:DUF2063 domain-containing protein [Aquitalea sp.]